MQMFNYWFVSTDVRRGTDSIKIQKDHTQIRNTGSFFHADCKEDCKRSWCVTLKEMLVAIPPLRLDCIKVHFSGCDAALYWIYKRSGSPPLSTAATRATHCTRTLSHWHMDGTQAMSKGLKPSGPESHTSIVLLASYRCSTLHRLFTSSSSFSFPFFFFFF